MVGGYVFKAKTVLIQDHFYSVLSFYFLVK